MHVLVTAGPTREYLDSVRFISNASSGRMGCAVAAAAARAGHEVTLILAEAIAGGHDYIRPGFVPEGCEIVPFASVAELKAALEARFAAADALVMVAAVGDFMPSERYPGKLSRAAGPIDLHLVPTPDVLASVAAGKRPGQTVVAFAVEEGTDEQVEAKARRELEAKGADYVVVNAPSAMGAEESRACILSADAVVLPWDTRPKYALAEDVAALLRRR